MARQKIRRLLLASAAFCCAAGFGAPAAAQAVYPKQRITMDIGFAAGGYADTIARLVGARLSARLGQTIVPENLEGGAGLRASREVAVAPPDGYTILATTTSLAINETLVPNRGYKADQLTAVAIPVSAPEALEANKTAGIKSVADLLDLAKRGKIFLGTPGLGTSSQIAQEYFFKVLAKTDIHYIPFASGNPATLGLLSGDTNVMAGTATGNPLQDMIRGEIIGVAVAAPTRSSLLPNVPTFAESGYPGFQASSWVGFFVPARTPAAIVERLNREINEVMQEDEIKTRIKSLGLEVSLRNTSETAAFFSGEIKNWSKMVGAVGGSQ